MLSVDLEGLEDEVKPKMKETSKKLRSVAVLLSDLVIPEDFKYRDKIKNMPDKIFNVEEDVKDDQKWLDTCITGFYNAEGSNKSIIDRIGNLASTTAGNFVDNTGSLLTRAFSKVSSTEENIMWEAFGLNENLLDKAGDILDYTGDALKYVGAKIGEGVNYLYDKAKPVIDEAKKVGASIANTAIGLIKGVGKVLEGIFDFGVMAGSLIASQYTAPLDMVRMGFSYLTGNADSYKSLTVEMWKKTMSFVSTKHVENAFSSFYKKNSIGKWLDNNAYKLFKSEGQGTKVAEGIGELLGIVGISALTFGTAPAAMAGTATVSGIGKHTEDAWSEMKKQSFEGIKEMYKNGEITEEQYNSYISIRELTDEQWNEIVLDYQNGEISEEQFKAMQQVREMPDDWRTAENALKGMAYGTANGVWEGVQWYVGGKLGNWAMEGKKLATSAVRVGADSVFNAGDTPFRAAMDVLASDKDFKTAWKEQGGWKSVLTNFGIGLIGSAGGEVLDNLGGKIGKNAELDDIADVAKSSEPIKLTDNAKISEFFDDPKGYLSSKLNIKSTEITDKNMKELAKKLSKEDRKTFKKLVENHRELSPEEVEILETFSLGSGPMLSAQLRESDVIYNSPEMPKGAVFKGKDKIVVFDDGTTQTFDKYLNSLHSLAIVRKNEDAIANGKKVSSKVEKIDINNEIEKLDKIIENSPELKKNIIVSRNVDGLFKDDEKLLTFNIGDTFDDKGFTSVSLDEGHFNNRKIELEIEIPKGTKAAYIQKYVKDVMGYGQQELVLARNSKFQITDVMQRDERTGKILIKAKLLSEADNGNLGKIDQLSIEKNILNGDIKEVNDIPDISQNFDFNSEQAKIIDDAIMLTLRKQGKEITPNIVKRLKEKIKNGEYNFITRDNGAREKVKELLKNDKEIFNTPNKILENNKEPISFKNESEIAEFFNDPKLFIASKSNINIKEIKKFSDDEIIQMANNLSNEDKIKLNKILKNQEILSQEDIEFLEVFALTSGPAYSAYKRGTKVEVLDQLLDGKEKKIISPEGWEMDFETAIAQGYEMARDKKIEVGKLNESELNNAYRNVDIDEDILRLDRIIEDSKPLQDSIIVKRRVNDIYKDNQRILTYDVGDTFNEKGYSSFAVYEGVYGRDNGIELEIEIPKGTKARYIQQYVTDVMGYGQQELLLGRNHTFQIVDKPYLDESTGKLIIRAKLITGNAESNLEHVGISSINKLNMNQKYYNNYNSTNLPKQVDLFNILNEMKSSGLLAQYRAEARDIRMSDLYDGITMQEHGLEHIDDVLFNAMYIGKSEGLNREEMGLLVEAAKFHDCGRELQGREHGIQGAKNSEYWLSIGHKDKDIAKIQAAIEYHATPDEKIGEVLNKYNIPSGQRKSVEKIAKILKDADALDRVRFPGNLNPQLLRTNTAKKMIKSSYQMQELRGKHYLKNTKFDESTKEIVDKLRNVGVSDYEISFWLKNYPTSEVEKQFAMPVWQKINSRMEKILEKLGG